MDTQRHEIKDQPNIEHWPKHMAMKRSATNSKQQPKLNWNENATNSSSCDVDDDRVRIGSLRYYFLERLNRHSRQLCPIISRIKWQKWKEKQSFGIEENEREKSIEPLDWRWRRKENEITIGRTKLTKQTQAHTLTHTPGKCVCKGKMAMEEEEEENEANAFKYYYYYYLPLSLSNENKIKCCQRLNALAMAMAKVRSLFCQ